MVDNKVLFDFKKGDLYKNIDGLSLQNMFIMNEGYFPNTLLMTDSQKGCNDCYVNTESLKKFILDKWANDLVSYVEYWLNDYNAGKDNIMYFNIINRSKHIYARIQPDITQTYILYGVNGYNDAVELKNEIFKYYEKKVDEVIEPTIYLVSRTATGFDLIDGNIKTIANLDINKLYNDGFSEVDEEVNSFINSDSSGLCILHGEKGSGKTTYIRSLISRHLDKKFVFVPSNIITMIGEPTFASFLFKLSNSVIILEDCETAIRSRSSNSGNNSAVNLLLNMCDGLLSDVFSIKFICTFNEDIKNIDEALLRKGRLAVKYEFNVLDERKTKVLIKENYGINYDGEGLTLADIFNFDKKSYIEKKAKIGF